MASYALNTRNNVKNGVTSKKNFQQIWMSLPLSLTIKKLLSWKGLKFPEKEHAESEFPGYIHIYIMCPKCWQSFTKFNAAL